MKLRFLFPLKTAAELSEYLGFMQSHSNLLFTTKSLPNEKWFWALTESAEGNEK